MCVCVCVCVRDLDTILDSVFPANSTFHKATHTFDVHQVGMLIFLQKCMFVEPYLCVTVDGWYVQGDESVYFFSCCILLDLGLCVSIHVCVCICVSVCMYVYVYEYGLVSPS